MDITVDAFSNVSEAGGGQPSLKRYDSLKAQQDTILSVIPEQWPQGLRLICSLPLMPSPVSPKEAIVLVAHTTFGSCTTSQAEGWILGFLSYIPPCHPPSFTP